MLYHLIQYFRHLYSLYFAIWNITCIYLLQHFGLIILYLEYPVSWSTWFNLLNHETCIFSSRIAQGCFSYPQRILPLCMWFQQLPSIFAGTWGPIYECAVYSFALCNCWSSYFLAIKESLDPSTVSVGSFLSITSQSCLTLSVMVIHKYQPWDTMTYIRKWN